MRIQDNKKLFVLCYMAGFFAGILYVNLISRAYIASTGIFNDYFLEEYAQTDLVVGEFFLYVAYIRFVPVVFLGALACTRMRKGVALGYILWTGFSSGMILTTSVMKMGARGILLCLLGLTPQFICYGAAYLMLLWFMFTYPHTRWNLSKTVSFALLVLTGIVLECYVNPVIMTFFLNTI